MELRQLKTFAMIAKLGSFTKAADILGYAQSTITAQIQALENELEVTLFERFARHIKLTRDGENLLGYAEQILKLTEAAKNQSNQGPVTGTIVIGSPESLCLCCLYDIIKEYRIRYQNVEIELHFGTCCEIHEMLSKNLIDLAFFLDDPIRDDNLISHILFDEPIVFVVSPQHPLAQKDSILPTDLTNQNLIVTEVGCTYRDRLDSLIKRDRLKPSSTMEVSSVELIKRLTKDNLGMSLLAKTTVQNELETNQLIALPWRGPSFDAKVQLVHHKEKYLSITLKSFIELTIQTLKRTNSL